MSEFSAIHAPARFRPQRRSALDFVALIAAVLALGLAAHLSGVRPHAAGVASPTFVQAHLR